MSHDRCEYQCGLAGRPGDCCVSVEGEAEVECAVASMGLAQHFAQNAAAQGAHLPKRCYPTILERADFGKFNECMYLKKADQCTGPEGKEHGCTWTTVDNMPNDSQTALLGAFRGYFGADAIPIPAYAGSVLESEPTTATAVYV